MQVRRLTPPSLFAKVYDFLEKRQSSIYTSLGNSERRYGWSDRQHRGPLSPTSKTLCHIINMACKVRLLTKPSRNRLLYRVSYQLVESANVCQLMGPKQNTLDTSGRGKARERRRMLPQAARPGKHHLTSALSSIGRGTKPGLLATAIRISQ